MHRRFGILLTVDASMMSLLLESDLNSESMGAKVHFLSTRQGVDAV